MTDITLEEADAMRSQLSTAIRERDEARERAYDLQKMLETRGRMIDALDAQLSTAIRERDEAREIVARVNNEVIGAYGYFTKPSCVEAVAEVKRQSNAYWRELELLRSQLSTADKEEGEGCTPKT